MHTKEKILKQALNLFSERGYQAVYVNEIAEAVGIKAPSLYKHYEGKKAIFDSCIQIYYERMQEMTNGLHLPGTDYESFSYSEVTEEQLIEITIAIFKFHLKDEVAAKLRKMLMIERYHNIELNMLFEELFLDEPIRFEEGLFKELIDVGVMKAVDARVLAYRYYTPIFFLLMKYDRHLEQEEEAIEELRKIVGEFYANYKVNEF